ncbi:phospholipase A1-like [Sabethes cyaneus]|uniref:phospholipase A1-like n=1 Tax=Sabethes cyaneus TaxID=53552 RepID=UPI00237D631C|nr:phospholipase A1-like [Sabethes cyaneus]
MILRKSELLYPTLLILFLGLTAEPQGHDENWIQIPTASGEMIWIPRQAVASQPRFKMDFQESDADFVFFSRNKPDGKIVRLDGIEYLHDELFNGSRPTRILVHGWLNDRHSPMSVNICDTYLIGWDFNVIVVDWSKCANRLNYITAASCVKAVGKLLARMLESLYTYKGLSLDDVYLIGHSLGAHVAGIAGKSLKRGNLSTIVALDPALPLFSLQDVENRVDIDDAAYVQVIHTNGGFLGFLDPIGMADFYPNGGATQPGCGLNFAGICAHSRAWQLFVESLMEPEEHLLAQPFYALQELPGVEKNNVVGTKLGGEPSNQATGMYYIDTNAQSPYFGPP